MFIGFDYINQKTGVVETGKNSSKVEIKTVLLPVLIVIKAGFPQTLIRYFRS